MRTIEFTGPAAHDGLVMTVPDDLVAAVAFTHDGNGGMHASLVSTLPDAVPAATVADMLDDLVRALRALPAGARL